MAEREPIGHQSEDVLLFFWGFFVVVPKTSWHSVLQRSEWWWQTCVRGQGGVVSAQQLEPIGCFGLRVADLPSVFSLCWYWYQVSTVAQRSERAPPLARSSLDKPQRDPCLRIITGLKETMDGWMDVACLSSCSIFPCDGCYNLVVAPENATSCYWKTTAEVAMLCHLFQVQQVFRANF